VSPETWTAVDRYLQAQLMPHDAALEQALADSDAAGLPAIHVSPLQGKFLHLLARLVGAKRVLEIGTLAGYSTIWLARALPAGGRVVTLEAEPRHAEVARRNLARASVADRVEIRIGPALETLPKLHAGNAGPFDLVFIDADKPGMPQYLEWSIRLARPGTAILADNVVRDGKVVNAASDDANVQGARRLFEKLAAEGRVSATALQTVGAKGYDGFALAIVTPSAPTP